MKLRALTLVGLVALSLSAVACSAESGPGATSSENDIHASTIANLSTAELKSQLAKAVDGLEYMSEADYPFDVFVAPGQVGASVDADAIKAAFNDLVSADSANGRMALKDMPGSSVHAFEDWMSGDTSNVDESDPDAVKYAKGMARAHDLMKANLTDLKVVLMAEESLENTEDVGFLHCFIVGRAKDGSLVALHTAVVWT